MPTKSKTTTVVDPATEAAEVAAHYDEQSQLFDNWDDDPAIIVCGGFDSELWAPENEGDHIVGFLIGRRLEVGPNKSTMYELDTQDGLRSVWGATVLDGKLENVPMNSLVRIEYMGERHGRDNTYFDWSVKFKLVPGRELAAAPAGDDVAPY